MKKAWVLTGICLMVTMAAVSASAWWSVEGHGIYVFELDGKLGQLESDTDDGFGVGAAVTYRMNEAARVTLGVDYLQVTATGANKYDVTLIPVTAGLRIGLPIQDTAFLYVGGGIGWSFNDLEVNGRKNRFMSVDDDLLYYGCAGLELNLGERVSVLAEFRNVWHEPAMDLSSMSIDFNLGHMQARGGLCILF